jgi:hypothetical protein
MKVVLCKVILEHSQRLVEMPKAPRNKKKNSKTINYGSNTMPPEEFLVGFRRMQTKRGRKERYAPIDPTIYPTEYKKPYFTLAAVHSLTKLVPDFPSGKIELQICDRKQNLTRVRMDRRLAFMKLLNQAMWRYKNFEKPEFIKPKDIFGKIEEIKASVEKLHMLLNQDKQDDAGRFVIDRLNNAKAPLIQTRLSTGKLGVYCKHLELMLQRHYQRFSPTASKTPRNQGDIPFHHLIDDLFIIWVVIFERDVGTSSKKDKHTGKNERTGPLIRFIGTILAKADITKSDDTIVKASRNWKRRYGESYKSEKI